MSFGKGEKTNMENTSITNQKLLKRGRYHLENGKQHLYKPPIVEFHVRCFFGGSDVYCSNLQLKKTAVAKETHLVSELV